MLTPMTYAVALVGLLIVVVSALGIAAPEHLATMVVGWTAETRLSVAVGTRLAMGVLFLVAAPRCRFPAVIRGLGILAVTAAVVLFLLGAGRVGGIVEWWAGQPGSFIRAWCVLSALVGALIVYAALPGSDQRRREPVR
jgi:hypothetical protein